MPIRGSRNPFPEKMKPQSNVFSTGPQKMDPPPPELKKERSVMEVALSKSGGRKHPMTGGASPEQVKRHAMRGPHARKRGKA